MPAHRARLPPNIRRKIQRAVRKFVFCGLTYVVLLEGYKNITLFLRYGDVTKYYGFV